MKKTLMPLSEAKRRLESTAVSRGYQTTGRWAEKMHKGEAIETYSMALTNLPQTRLVLWKQDKQWWGMIAVQVGEDGEYPITGGSFTPDSSCHMSTYSFMLPRIEQVMEAVVRWTGEMYSLWGDKAVMRLAIYCIKHGKIKRALSLLFAAVRGEFEACTVSEALSLVQWRWFKTKDEMLISCRIWSEVFR